MSNFDAKLFLSVVIHIRNKDLTAMRINIRVRRTDPIASKKQLK